MVSLVLRWTKDEDDRTFYDIVLVATMARVPLAIIVRAARLVRKVDRARKRDKLQAGDLSQTLSRTELSESSTMKQIRRSVCARRWRRQTRA